MGLIYNLMNRAERSSAKKVNQHGEIQVQAHSRAVILTKETRLGEGDEAEEGAVVVAS